MNPGTTCPEGAAAERESSVHSTATMLSSSTVTPHARPATM